MNFLNSPGAALVRSLGGGAIMDKMGRFQDRVSGSGLSSPPPPSQMPQLPTAQPMSAYAVDAAGWTPDQEKQARAAGFPSAQAAMDWQRQRQQPRTQQTVAGTPQGQAPEQPQPPASGNAMGWHPATVFGWLRDKLAGANGQGK